MANPGEWQQAPGMDGWRSVRTGLLLVMFGLIAYAAVAEIFAMLHTSVLSRLFSGPLDEAEADRLVRSLDLYGNLSTPLYSVGLIAALVGAIGLCRIPGGGRARRLALFALIAGAVTLLIDLGLCVLQMVDKLSKIQESPTLSRITALTTIIAFALMLTFLFFAIRAATARARVPAPLALMVVGLVFVGIALLFDGYMIIDQPRWTLRRENPWAWHLLRAAAPWARDAVLAVFAGVAAARVRRVSVR